MVTREANFEGQNPGTAVGVANSSAFGDDPFDLVAVSGMTCLYGNTAMHGTGGVSFGTAVSGQFAQLGYGAFTNTKCVVRFYIRVRVYPTNEFQFLHFHNSASGTLPALNLTPTGTIKVVGLSSVLMYTSTAALSLNTWYRVEFAATISSTAGQIKFSAFTGDSTTVIAGATYDSGTALNTGSSVINEADLGKITSSAATGAFDIDDFAVNDGSTTFLGPYVNTAPSPRAVVTTGSAVIDCTSTTPGVTGDTIVYTISPSTGTTQPARGVFLAPQQASPVTYTITASESNGTSKNVTAVVPAASGTGPSSTVPKTYTNGQWV